MYCEMMSRKLAQFWYQSNSVQFLIDTNVLSITLFPEGLLPVVTIFFKIHSELQIRSFNNYQISQHLPINQILPLSDLRIRPISTLTAHQRLDNLSHNLLATGSITAVRTEMIASRLFIAVALVMDDLQWGKE